MVLGRYLSTEQWGCGSGAGMKGQAAWAEVFGDLAGVRRDLGRLEAEGRYRGDAWAWIKECVWTVDEVDAEETIKPFPVAVCVGCNRYMGHREGGRCRRCGVVGQPMKYLEVLAREWQRGKPEILIVPKARRMRLTWLFVSLNVWMCMYRKNANCWFVSSKEEKSGDLVSRAKGIVERLPQDLLEPVKTYHRNSPPELRFLETGSKIMGVPEGADQLRQYASTSILADEIASWEWPRAAYTAMKPTIEGGGRMTLLSSAYPGFYRELCAGEII